MAQWVFPEFVQSGIYKIFFEIPVLLRTILRGLGGNLKA